MENFTSLISDPQRPFSLTAVQKMKTNDLFRNLGDESSSNSISIRLNPSNGADNNDKASAVVIPGFQGVGSETWCTFAADLSTPTYLIPINKSKDATSFEAIAESIYSIVDSCFARQKQFYIIGYSFGAIVALQLAQMLENNGRRGRVLLIDGSPIYLKKMFTNMLPSTAIKDSQLEDVLITLQYFGMCDATRPYDFMDQLQNWDEWSQKIDLLFRFLPGEVKEKYSKQYMRDLLTAMLARLKTVVKADTGTVLEKVKLKSPITLVRPKLTLMANVAEDLGLSAYAEQKVDVRYTEGNHANMLSNDIIMQLVDKLAPVE